MADTTATWQHIALLASKRATLTQRLNESIDQLCEMVRRTPMEPIAAWEMYQEIRTFGIEGASTKFADATGLGVRGMSDISRFGAPFKPGTRLTSNDVPLVVPRPGTQVVYGLIDDGCVVYVGLTGHFSSRLRAHRSSEKTFDGWILYTHEDRKHAAEHEATLIAHFKPKYNVAGVWA